MRDRSVYFGPPEKIVQQVLRLHRETGISSVIFKTSWAGLPHAVARDSVRRLGTEVIPAIRAALHSERRAVAAVVSRTHDGSYTAHVVPYGDGCR